MKRRGFTLVELAAVVATGAVLASVAQITPYVSPAQKRMQSLNNLRAIGTANAQYRADNAGYFPIEGSATSSPRRDPANPPRGINAWCTWSYAGKNNNGWWRSTSGFTRPFDIEAADRPLNTYLYPTMVFTAPPIPDPLPADSPARLTEQAPINRDPADGWTNQREWPNVTKGVSTYDDVGSSYLWTATWWSQLNSISDWTNRMNAGTARLATGMGVTPSRFVWCSDPFVELTTNQSSTMAMVRGWHGEMNKSVMLFYDGHADYLPTFPGRKQRSYSNEFYSLIFDDLPNPGTP